MQWKADLYLGDSYSCTRLRCGSQPDLCTKHNIQLHHLKFQSFVSPFQWLFGHWHFSVKTSLWNQKGLWGEPWGAGRQTMILSTLQPANSLLQTMGSLTWQGHQSFQRRELRDFPFLQQLRCKIQDKDGQKPVRKQNDSCSCLAAQSFATPWTEFCQAPLSMEFSRQEYWSGLPLPSPRELSNPRTEPRSPALQADSLPSESPGKPWMIYKAIRQRLWEWWVHFSMWSCAVHMSEDLAVLGLKVMMGFQTHIC